MDLYGLEFESAFPLYIPLAMALEIFICPISHSLFNHPILASDGFSYEQSAFEEWLATSAKTGQPLPIDRGRVGPRNIAQ